MVQRPRSEAIARGDSAPGDEDVASEDEAPQEDRTLQRRPSSRQREEERRDPALGDGDSGDGHRHLGAPDGSIEGRQLTVDVGDAHVVEIDQRDRTVRIPHNPIRGADTIVSQGRSRRNRISRGSSRYRESRPSTASSALPDCASDSSSRSAYFHFDTA